MIPVWSGRPRDVKLIEASKGPALHKQVNIESGNAPGVQLYDLRSDPGELNNVAAENQECVVDMAKLLSRIRETGASR